ncbi:hypothetical protein N7365_17580 [Pseudomonas sediminis]|uniref:hypothetical protein n=1 Tax=Pseudomonas sediminis TaxID=1691904 RepID=UPI0024489431|nr:hypothetical protein [Pseudomonas sediminis]MDG9759904.1 hypothetical protein [Pseudomonas sediminis]
MGLLLTQTTVVEAVFHGQVDAAQIRHWLADIERLIEQRQPFFFISSTRTGSAFIEDYRAIQGVWYKQHKAAFREVCQGLVRIADDAEEQARLDTPALHAAWGVPYFVTQDRAHGYRWIAERMVSHAASV